ncbi:hypothetical protein HN954_00780 [bacterium]|jgi:hypothetical protein|nr:hypothetical protein [bacterium]MBT6831569.1 hypothetical protein [bacterium]MBT6995948.1 hypothetical protein [bacterium]MBT7772395.1 hypothetical protein [bacterium]
MFRRIYRYGWHSQKKKSRRSVFGGEVKSMEEVREFSKKMREHEQKEMAAFEKKFDAVADDVWKNKKNA